MNYLIKKDRRLSQKEKEKMLNQAVANAEIEGVYIYR